MATTGRGLFYASRLLRLKSDSILQEDTEDEEPTDDDDPMQAFNAEPADDDPLAAFDDELDRRLDRKDTRDGVPETLDGLVRELREQEKEKDWKDSRSYDTEESPSGFDRGEQELEYRSADEFRIENEPESDDVLGTSHDEDIETTIEAVLAELETQYERGRNELLFAELVFDAYSRVELFLAVLFLSHRGKVHLEQDDLFGDLWLQEQQKP